MATEHPFHAASSDPRGAEDLEKTKADFLHTVRSLLARDGERWTRQRQIIADMLPEIPPHSTVEAIAQAVRHRYPHTSVATIYRAIKLFTSIGVLVRLATKNGSGCYKISLGSGTNYHLVDILSGQVVEFSDPHLACSISDAVAKLGYRLAGGSIGIHVVPCIPGQAAHLP